jgi:hypothetical protein
MLWALVHSCLGALVDGEVGPLARAHPEIFSASCMSLQNLSSSACCCCCCCFCACTRCMSWSVPSGSTALSRVANANTSCTHQYLKKCSGRGCLYPVRVAPYRDQHRLQLVREWSFAQVVHLALDNRVDPLMPWNIPQVVWWRRMW